MQKSKNRISIEIIKNDKKNLNLNLIKQSKDFFYYEKIYIFKINKN